MITFAPPSARAWHICGMEPGTAVCGLAVDPSWLARPNELTARRWQNVCPDCWQEYFTGRQTPPHLWYEEFETMTTATARKSRKRDYALNEFGVFEKPEVISLKVAKSHKVTCELELAEDDQGRWCYGYGFSFQSGGASSAPTSSANGLFDNRSEALLLVIGCAERWFNSQRGASAAITKACVAVLEMLAELRRKTEAGLNGSRGNANGKQLPHPGTTSSTTPAGIAHNDRLAHGFTDDVEDLPGGGMSSGDSIHRIRDKLMAGTVQEIPLHLIAVSPYQPRIKPGDAKIAELAEAMTSWGFKGAIEVRPIKSGKALFSQAKTPARYELIDGERRVRAAHLAKLAAIPAIVRELDDATAEEHVLIANEGREDLTPLERGHVIKRLLEKGRSQAEVGKMLGLSQGAVSNKTRILELPAEWLDGSIHPKLSASESHLREVCAYRSSPKLLEILAKEAKRGLKRDGEEGFPNVSDWARELRGSAMRATEPMTGETYDNTIHSYVSIFKPTPEQREQLDIVEIVDWQGKASERAINKKLWGKLQEQHAADQRKKKAKKQDAKEKKETAQLTPAQQKQRDKEQAEKFAKRLRVWVNDWRQWLCYEELAETNSVDEATRQALLGYLACSQAGGDGNWNGCSWDAREKRLVAAIKLHVPDLPKPKKSPDRSKAWLHLQQCNEYAGRAALEPVLRQWLRWTLFVEEEDAKSIGCDPGPQNALPPEVIESLASALLVDLSVAWMVNTAGPLTYRYWAMHSKEQLLALGQELGVPLPANGGKADLIQQLDAAKPGRIPQEILGAKGGKG